MVKTESIKTKSFVEDKKIEKLARRVLAGQTG